MNDAIRVQILNSLNYLMNEVLSSVLRDFEMPIA